jgi:hypothetical protein
MILSGYGSGVHICKPDARVASDGPVTTSTSKSQAMRVSLLQNTYPCPVRQRRELVDVAVGNGPVLISPMQKFSS